MANLVPNSKHGAFKPDEAQFRHSISRKPGAPFPPEVGRYHLYISYACPFACRCLALLNLKGLRHAIAISVTKAAMASTKPIVDDHRGWIFLTPGEEDNDRDDEHGATIDPLNHVRTVRELYEIANPNYAGRFSVPVLWDSKTRQIVNNESPEIMRMLNSEFNDGIAKHPEVNLYPERLKVAIDDVNCWVFSDINVGVYKCGFATKQEPFEEAFRALFAALDKCEQILSKQRYIAGDELTEADVRLFTTLIRFDEVYAVHFKCNKRLIREYPNLFNYTKDLFQMKGIGETVDMWHIKQNYYRSHLHLNPYGIVPVGQEVDYSAPHDRDRFQTKRVPS
ncbi:unnamed protein product [Calypogeia fissa]